MNISISTVAAAAGATADILIAEDSATQAQQLRYILEQKGYRVTVAANGQLALAAARQHKPTLIISDVVMPEMDGYELCRHIKADDRLADIPVILVTTLSDPHDVIRGLECRADNFILKPYDENHLLGRVQFVLLNREMRQSEQPGMGLEIFFNGEKHFITADRLQILNLLLSTYEAAMQRNKELTSTQDMLQQTNSDLQQLTHDLEDRVLRRTHDLENTNRALRREIADRERAEHKLQAQLVRRDLLNRITRAIGERQDLNSIFQVVIVSLEDHLPIEFGCICRYDAAQNSLSIDSAGIKGREVLPDLTLPELASVDVGLNGLFRCVEGELVYEPDISQLKLPFMERLAQGGLHSMVAAPLRVEGKVFGLLIAARRQRLGFSSDECEFLRQLSEHVALAVHQTQLYKDLQQAYDDLRKTQQTVMQQERLRALGQMASGIAHDINNAISPIVLYTDSLLERERHLSESGREYLTTIQRAIDDVAQTVSRLREFYRPRERELALVDVDLNLLIRQVIDLTRARWSDQPQRRGVMVEVKTELTDNLPNIRGAESEIRDALTNLIFNAVDAMPDGGTLTLRTGVTGPEPCVYMDVSDTGSGMDDDTRRHCLEPFFTTKGERGTGLGLAMVYGVAQRHHAKIQIDSEVGHGTTIRLDFPTHSDSTHHPNVVLSSIALPSLRILTIDDDPLLLKSLRDTLESDGHSVTTANGGQEGIDAFTAAQKNTDAFAVVITDLGMPYVDGRKVAHAVKNLSNSTPVILLTGWGQRLITDGDIPPHVDLVLSKPPKLRQLREALAQCHASQVPRRNPV